MLCVGNDFKSKLTFYKISRVAFCDVERKQFQNVESNFEASYYS